MDLVIQFGVEVHYRSVPCQSFWCQSLQKGLTPAFLEAFLLLLLSISLGLLKYIQDKKDIDVYFSSIHDLLSMLTYCSKSPSAISPCTVADVHYLVNLILLLLFLEFWCNCSCSGVVVIFLFWKNCDS